MAIKGGSGYVTVAEAAARLHVHVQTIYLWIREGRIQSAKFGRVRGVRIPIAELERFEREGLGGGSRESNIESPALVAA